MLDNLAMLDYVGPSGARLSYLARWDGVMQRLSLGTAFLLALAIIAIGAGYVASPTAATRSFGLPLPETGANILWWLRLKGVRDIAAGLAVLAFMTWGAPRAVGLILAVEAIIPVGDMAVVLAAKGSTRSAFGVHGVTAVVMVLAATPLMIGGA
jgi:Domain of unknown function (DUF4267)